MNTTSIITVIIIAIAGIVIGFRMTKTEDKRTALMKSELTHTLNVAAWETEKLLNTHLDRFHAYGEQYDYGMANAHALYLVMILNRLWPEHSYFGGETDLGYIDFVEITQGLLAGDHLD